MASATLHQALLDEAGARDAVGIALARGAGAGPARSAFRGAWSIGWPVSRPSWPTSAEEARSLADGIDHDPAAIAELDARLGVIHGLVRRYGDDETAVIAHGEQAAVEAERLRGLDDERARRQAADARLLLEVATAAAALSAARTATARSLSEQRRQRPGRARLRGRCVRGRHRSSAGRRR